jgi:hypothetical protein
MTIDPKFCWSSIIMYDVILWLTSDRKFYWLGIPAFEVVLGLASGPNHTGNHHIFKVVLGPTSDPKFCRLNIIG